MARPATKYKTLTKEYLEDLYVRCGMSFNEIIRVTGISRGALQRRFNKFGIPRRSMSDALRLAVLTGRHHTLSGDKVWNWKGGRRVHLGYIKLKQPRHPHADKQGYVFEHVLVWEAANNQALPLDWVIHHLNGVKDDNRAENLAAMPRNEHDRLIATYRNRILLLEAEIVVLKVEGIK